MIAINGIKVESIDDIRRTWAEIAYRCYKSPCGCTAIYLYDGSRVGDWTTLDRNVHLNEGARVEEWARIGYGSILGRLSRVGYAATIGGGVKLGERARVGYRATIDNRTTVGDNAIVGDGAVIGRGCTIPHGFVIAAGAVLGDGYDLPTQPLWFCGPRHSIGYHSPGMIASDGCVKSVDWWLENIRQWAQRHCYTPDEIREYVFRVRALESWMIEGGVRK